MIQEVGIGLLGLGTVGSGVVSLLEDNGTVIAHKLGTSLRLKRVLVRNLDRQRSVAVDPAILTVSFSDILNDPGIQVIVEVMGGTDPALGYTLSALAAGKSIVTANKDVMALFGKELFAAAGETGADLFFEASVCGGIPIIQPLKESLAANRILRIMGIINGTTNYILSKMSKEGRKFTEALAEAQARGYAEADPTADIAGLDAARKLAILSSIAFNTRLTYHDVYVEGIDRISPEDILYGRELGYTLKLLAIGQEVDGSIEARVHPAFIPSSHPLATVDGVFNAIYVCGDAVGETMFYGQGAGMLPTASAVVGDIIAAVRNISFNCRGRVSCTCYENKPLRSVNEIESRYYLRLIVKDSPGVLAGIASVLGNQGVSLATVIQKNSKGQGLAELVLITHRVKEAQVQDAVKIISGLSAVSGLANLVRVEGEII